MVRVEPMTRAGTPPTMAWSGTAPVTTAPAATTTRRPTEAPGRIIAPLPIQLPAPMCTGRGSWACTLIGRSGSDQSWFWSEM